MEFSFVPFFNFWAPGSLQKFQSSASVSLELRGAGGQPRGTALLTPCPQPNWHGGSLHYMQWARVGPWAHTGPRHADAPREGQEEPPRALQAGGGPALGISCSWPGAAQEMRTREGEGERGGKKKLMTHNCHDSGIGPRQLFYIPGMYSMQISTKGRHSFSIVDPEGNQISLWQPW